MNLEMFVTILGLAGSGAASTVASAFGVPSEAGRGAMAQDLAVTHAPERARDGRLNAEILR